MQTQKKKEYHPICNLLYHGRILFCMLLFKSILSLCFTRAIAKSTSRVFSTFPYYFRRAEVEKDYSIQKPLHRSKKTM